MLRTDAQSPSRCRFCPKTGTNNPITKELYRRWMIFNEDLRIREFYRFEIKPFHYFVFKRFARISRIQLNYNKPLTVHY